MLLRLPAADASSARGPTSPHIPDRMKKMPETKARMVRWGRMCPMLLMTKAVKTKSNETIGKGVAVRTISAGARDGRVHLRKEQVGEYSWWNFSVQVGMLLTENVGCVFCRDFYFWLSEIL